MRKLQFTSMFPNIFPKMCYSWYTCCSILHVNDMKNYRYEVNKKYNARYTWDEYKITVDPEYIYQQSRHGFQI